MPPEKGRTSRRLAIYWHIFAKAAPLFEARLDSVLSRQLAVLEASGLLAIATVRVGLVGEGRSPALRRVLRHPRMHVVAESATGYECVTTDALHAHRSEYDVVLYMHSRGTTHIHNSTADRCADDWTQMMEYVLITNWRYAVWRIAQGANTAGAELCSHSSHLGSNLPHVYHYSGSFFWASSAYLATLSSPSVLVRRVPPAKQTAVRYLCSEDWLFDGITPDRLNFDKFAVLHYTGVRMGARGRIHSYKDRYPPEYYVCPSTPRPGPTSSAVAAPGKPWWMQASWTNGHSQASGVIPAPSWALNPPALTPCINLTYICHGKLCTHQLRVRSLKRRSRLPGQTRG